MVIAKKGFVVPLKSRISVELYTFAEKFWRNAAVCLKPGKWSTPLALVHADREVDSFTIQYFFYSDSPCLSVGRVLYPTPLLGAEGAVYSAIDRILHWNGEKQRNMLELGFERFSLADTEPGPAWFIDEGEGAPDGCWILTNSGTLE